MNKGVAHPSSPERNTQGHVDSFLKLVFVSISASPGSLPGGAFFMGSGSVNRQERLPGDSAVKHSLSTQIFRLSDTFRAEILKPDVVAFAGPKQ